MPKLNPNRSLVYEKLAARRIGEARKGAGWSLDDLARRVTAAGSPMDRGTLHRVERGTRRVHLDELVAFATIFDVPVGTLLSSIDAEVNKLMQRHAMLERRSHETATQMRLIEEHLLELDV